MKLYRYMSRFEYRRHFPKSSRRYKKLLWAVSLKPGDVISACTGFNVRIAEVRYEWMTRASWYGKGQFRGRNGEWICDVQVTDTAGLWHNTDTCCSRAETVEQIEEFWKSGSEEAILEQERLGWNMSNTRKLRALLREGKPICDKDGVILPGLESVRP